MTNLRWKKAVALMMTAAMAVSLAGCAKPAPQAAGAGAAGTAKTAEPAGDAGTGNTGTGNAGAGNTETGNTAAAEKQPEAAGAGAQELPVLRVSLHPAYISTPVAYAIYNDMAKDYGFQMDVQVYASGAPQNEALGSGLWDVGVIGGAFVNSVNTYDAYAIGDFIDGRDGNAIFVRKDSPIAHATGSNPTYPDILGSAETVKGSTLITNLGTTGHVQVQKWLEALGLTEDDIQIVQMDYASGYQAFASGEGDILATIGPYSTRAYISHKDDWAIAGGFIALDLLQYENIVCSNSAMQEKRDLLVSFIRMVMDANDILAEDHELLVKTYMQWMVDNGKEVDEEEARMECVQKPVMTSEQIRALIDDGFGDYERMVWEMNIESGNISADSIKKLDTNLTADLMREALER